MGGIKNIPVYSALIFILLIAGCYSPEKIVQYQPEDIIGGKKDTLPPKIVVYSPKADQKRGIAVVNADMEVTIEGMVFDTGSRVAAFSINNKEVFLAGDGSFSHSLPVSPGANTLTLTAVDAENNRATTTLVIKGVKQTSFPASTAAHKTPARKPSLWVLSVGISRYNDRALHLKYADNDALKMADTLKNLKGGIFSEVRVQTLLNEHATRSSILSAMAEHLGKAAPDDVVFIFVAGHGAKNVQTGSYYFVPYNADFQNLLFEGLKWSDFDEAVKIISGNVNKVVLVLDTCHSGAINVAMRGPATGEDLAATLRAATGLYILSASKGGETSVEGPDFKFPSETGGHGAFTYALLKGLKGEANYDKNAYLTIGELFDYVAAQVPRMTNGRQHPYSKIEGTALPIASFK